MDSLKENGGYASADFLQRYIAFMTTSGSHRLARTAALEHLAFTHPGALMRAAAALIVDLLLAVLAGTPLREAVVAQIDAQPKRASAIPQKGK